MKMIVAAVLALAVGIVAVEASAQVTFSAPIQFAGTGCKLGSSFSFTGQGTNTMTVMFSAYDAAKPASRAASKMERTSCNFAVPINVPPGYQVSLMTADWRGYTEKSTQISREYFIAGQRGPSRTTSPSGNFTESDHLIFGSWNSKCGAGKVTMRINSSVRAVSNPSYIAVGTEDLQNKVVFYLNWRKC